MTRTMQRLNRFVAAIFRAPVKVYDWHAGWLFGHRLLLLTHIGRRTGLPRRAVLEVVRYEPADSEATVVRGFGPGTDWFRNLEANGRAEVSIARQRYLAEHRILSADEAVAVLAAYERRNRLIAPIARFLLGRLAGWRYTSSETDRRRLVNQLPFVAFRPRHDAVTPGDPPVGRRSSAPPR